jgi:hypothetical protein
VTHYPVWIADGRRERRIRALRDLDDLLDICVRGGISLWLHGHRHHNYHTPPFEQVPFPVICAGSATQRGRWAYKDYTLVGHRLTVVTRMFDSEKNAFVDGRTYQLELRTTPSAALEATPGG